MQNCKENKKEGKATFISNSNALMLLQEIVA